MGDLGINTATPPGKEAARLRHSYYTSMARLAQLEMQKEDLRVQHERLEAEESELLKQVAEYEKKNPK